MYMSYRLLIRLGTPHGDFYHVQYQRTSEPEPDQWTTYHNGVFTNKPEAEAFLARKVGDKYPGAQYFRDTDKTIDKRNQEVALQAAS